MKSSHGKMDDLQKMEKSVRSAMWMHNSTHAHGVNRTLNVLTPFWVHHHSGKHSPHEVLHKQCVPTPADVFGWDETDGLKVLFETKSPNAPGSSAECKRRLTYMVIVNGQGSLMFTLEK